MSSSSLSLLLALPLAAVGLAVLDASLADETRWLGTQQTGTTQPGTQAHGSQPLGTKQLEAQPADPFADSDGDLLPDRLEWVLLLDAQDPDSDHDGVDDFLHAVQGRRGLVEPRTTFGYDDEARAVVSGVPDAAGVRRIWVSLLFRFAGANLGDLTSLTPYVDCWGTRLPLASLIGTGGTHLAFLTHPTEGLYALCSFELASESLFRSLLPCTIGATVVMGGRTISTGSYLTDAAGETATLVAVAPDSGVIQTLAAEDEDDPFWVSSRVCLLRLAVVTPMANGALCEVSDANCVSSGQLACPPTCRSSRGQMLFFPDGMSTVTGGGGH